jgi:hypothetical protein
MVLFTAIAQGLFNLIKVIFTMMEHLLLTDLVADLPQAVRLRWPAGWD